MEELDKNIIAVQNSTKTRFKYFLRWHDFLRLRFHWYYNWHTRPYSSAVHYGISLFFVVAGLYGTLGYSGITRAAVDYLTPNKNLSSLTSVIADQKSLKPSTSEETSASNNISDEKIQTLIEQVSVLATNEMLKTVAAEFSDIKTLSSEATQNEIKNSIETSLAKDDSVKALLQSISTGNDSNKTALASLSSLLAKVASESTLITLADQIETGLAKEETLNKIYTKLESNLGREETLKEISAKLESGLAKEGTLSEMNSKMETGLAKDETLTESIDSLLLRLDAIESALSGTLNVSVANWISSITISNFPTDFPSSSSTRAQEQVGDDYFNKSENLDLWALRKGYSKSYFSGEITNPTPTAGPAEVGRLTVPAGHTYYLSQISISSTGTRKNVYKILLLIGGSETLQDKVGFSETDVRILPYAKKLIAGEQVRVTIEGVSTPNGVSTISVSYIDLPWTE